MEYIDGLFQIAQNNFALTFFIGFAAAFSETFFSPLPLLGIVIANSLFLGFVPGLIASTLGSVLGSIVLFFLCKKFGNSKLMNKLNNSQVNKIIGWVRNQGFAPMTICYCCPFVPGFLVTIASGISKKSFNKFFPGLLCGKIIMFSIASYIGNDIIGFFTNPIKIIVVLIIIIASFVIGKKLSKGMEQSENSNYVLN